MKNFFKIILSVTLFIGLLSSCENEEVDTFEDISQMTKDKIFSDFIEKEYSVINQISDIDQVLKLSQKNESLSKEELNELSIALGFNNYQEYEDFYLEQKKSLEKLDAKYNYRSYGDEEIQRLIERDLKNMESYTLYVEKLFAVDETTLRLKSNNCQELAENCVYTANVVAFTAHLGCATLDVTIIFGLGCHASVYALHRLQQNKCILDYENCISLGGAQ